MKKLLYYTIYLLLVLFISACSQQTHSDEKTESTETKETNQQGKQTDQALEPKQVQWSYEGKRGPKHWGDLAEEFAACEKGNEQSPVNVKFAEVEEEKDLPEIQLHYEPAKVSVINNGHTAQFNLPNEMNNSMTIGETNYRLIQFHFHTPSEHQFNGKHFPVEMHFVHKNPNNELAVTTLMIEEGTQNKELASIWGGVPSEKTEKEIMMNEPVDLASLLPRQSSTTFHYSGSLTTPPCSEDVKWIIFEDTIEISKEQIDVFKQIFPSNNRPIQLLNEREVMKNS
ncbi:carbonic anhydrase [Halobacillus naozhouensis]|uniref:Carbonic anhydrase family protein n=1 Tax=Halobacillus naozhouensis TaxID=554880 RepID=A0ABY8J0G1_9BACI|nr:carbonic anhydrase family protein [Halobacillus naozhouensis]WFT75556.1 carbonic anhydrase family protein [Halobacillus naozhouensis]